MPDITSANAVIIISVPLLLPVPQQLQGFAVDDIYDTDEIAETDTLMGADGILSGGKVFAAIPQNFMLQADSPSISFFDAWAAGQNVQIGAFAAQATTTFPNLGRSFTMVNGYLERRKALPDAKRVLQPQRFRIVWNRVIASPVGITG